MISYRRNRWLALGPAVPTLVLALSLVGRVSAQTMTMNDITCGGGICGTSTYSEIGFTLSAVADGGGAVGLAYVSPLSPEYTGSNAFVVNTIPGIGRLSSSDASLFSLFSIDLASAFVDGGATSVFFSGVLGVGGSVNATFDVPATSGVPIMQTYFFGPEWTGLANVDITQSWFTQFDNITFSDPTSTVPEPTTMLLLATGLAGLGAGRRWKQHR